MEGSDFLEADGSKGGLLASVFEARDEMPRTGCKERINRFYRRKNRTRRQCGLEMSKECRQREGQLWTGVGCGGEHTGRTGQDHGRV